MEDAGKKQSNRKGRRQVSQSWEQVTGCLTLNLDQTASKEYTSSLWRVQREKVSPMNRKSRTKNPHERIQQTFEGVYTDQKYAVSSKNLERRGIELASPEIQE